MENIVDIAFTHWIFKQLNSEVKVLYLQLLNKTVTAFLHGRALIVYMLATLIFYWGKTNVHIFLI